VANLVYADAIFLCDSS